MVLFNKRKLFSCKSILKLLYDPCLPQKEGTDGTDYVKSFSERSVTLQKTL